MFGFGRRKKGAKDKAKGKQENSVPPTSSEPLEGVGVPGQGIEQGDPAEGLEPAVLEPVNLLEGEENTQEGEQEGGEDDLLNIFKETEAEGVSVYRGLQGSVPEVDVQDLRAEAMRVLAVLRMRSQG